MKPSAPRPGCSIENVIDPAVAEEYAQWFHCLSDPTRLTILNVVARHQGPLTVGEITEQVGRSQSTVSKHLQILAAECFVLTEVDGIRTLVTINESCMSALPRAAAEIMAAPSLNPPTEENNR